MPFEKSRLLLALGAAELDFAIAAGDADRDSLVYFWRFDLIGAGMGFEFLPFGRLLGFGVADAAPVGLFEGQGSGLAGTFSRLRVNAQDALLLRLLFIILFIF